MDSDYRNLNLSRLKPCDQYWSQMRKTSKGRVCSKCSSTIYDFRGKSKAEIALIHAKSDGNVCGLYSKDQFRATKILDKSKGRSFLLKPALFGLLSLSLNKNAEAMPSNKTAKIEAGYELRPYNSTAEHSYRPKQFKQDSSFIQGQVKIIDGLDTISQPGINILIEGTEVGTTSDIDGNYILSVPTEIPTQDSITVIFNFIGYLTKRVTIDNKTHTLDIILTPDDTQLSEFYIYAKPPLHQRVWFWITKPFRK